MVWLSSHHSSQNIFGGRMLKTKNFQSMFSFSNMFWVIYTLSQSSHTDENYPIKRTILSDPNDFEACLSCFSLFGMDCPSDAQIWAEIFLKEDILTFLLSNCWSIML